MASQGGEPPIFSIENCWGHTPLVLGTSWCCWELTEGEQVVEGQGARDVGEEC